jgi:hypothetical protein
MPSQKPPESDKSERDELDISKYRAKLVSSFAFRPTDDQPINDVDSTPRTELRGNVIDQSDEVGDSERCEPLFKTREKPRSSQHSNAANRYEPNKTEIEGVAVARYKRGVGKKQRKIYQCTPISADVVKYEVGKPTELNAQEKSLPEVSSTVKSILDLRNEAGRRRYGYSNVRRILGAAILSPDPKKHIPVSHRAGTDETKSPFPATAIFVEWQGILEDDIHLLIGGENKSWEMRSKLLSATTKRSIDELNNCIIRKLDPGQAEPQPERDDAQMDAGKPKSKKRGRKDSDATQGQSESAKKLRAHQEATSQPGQEREDGTLKDGKEVYEKKESKKRARNDSDPALDAKSAKKCRKDSEAADPNGSA